MEQPPPQQSLTASPEQPAEHPLLQGRSCSHRQSGAIHLVNYQWGTNIWGGGPRLGDSLEAAAFEGRESQGKILRAQFCSC